MDEIMDTKVVQMKFDNSQFRAGVQDTIKQLEQLENSLELKGASDGLDIVTKASKQTTDSLVSVGSAVDDVSRHFSALEIVGITVMMRLTNAAIDFGKKITTNLWSNTLGQVISGGKARAQNIANAKFQLEGLGLAWKDIEEDINYGVKSTAYGLDEAAKAAAQMVASMDLSMGYTEAQSVEMRTALRAISGVAAMTNSSYSEIADIFTTVSSNGKLMTMQLRQLAARGLNASAILAKAMHTSEEAVNQMVTAGKINFHEFSQAMDDAFGKHAKEANATFQGSLSNVKSALSRIGAKFADPIYDSLKNVFNGLMPVIDRINKALTPVVEIFSRGVQILGDWITSFLEIEDTSRAIMQWVINLYSYARPVIQAFLDVFAQYLPRLDLSAKNFTEFAKKFTLTGEKAEKVRVVFQNIFGVIDLIIHATKSMFSLLSTVGKSVFELFGGLLGQTVPVNNSLWGICLALRDILEVGTKMLQSKIVAMFEQLKIILRSLDWQKILGYVKNIVIAIAIAYNIIAQLVKFAIANFRNLLPVIQAIGLAIGGLVSLAIRGFSTLIPIVQNAKNIVLGFAGALVYAMSAIGSLFAGIFGKGSELVTKVIGSVNFLREKLSASDVVEASGVESGVQELSNTATTLTETVLTETTLVEDVIEETTDRVDVLSKTAREAGKSFGFLRDNAKGINSALLGSKDENQLPDHTQLTHKATRLKVEPGNRAEDWLPVSNTVKMGLFETLAQYFVGDESHVITRIAIKIDGFFGVIFNYFKDVYYTFTDKIAKLVSGLNPAKILAYAWDASLIVSAIGVIALIGKLFKAVFGLLMFIPNLGIAARNVATGYLIRSTAVIFKDLIALIAVTAASIAGLMLVTNYVDVDDFERTMAAVVKLINALSLMFTVLFGVSIIGNFVPIANALKGEIQPINKLGLGILPDFFKSLAVMIGTIVASIWLLDQIKFTDELKEKMLLVFGTIGAFVLIFSVIAKLFSFKLQAATSVLTVTAKGLTKSTRSFTNMYADIFIAISLMIATVTASLALLTLIDYDKLKNVMNILAPITIIVSLCAALNAISLHGVDPKSVQNMGLLVKNLASVTSSIGLLVLSVAAALKLIATIEITKENREAFNAFGSVMMLFSILMGVIRIISLIGQLASKVYLLEKGESMFTKANDVGKSITTAILAMSVLILAVSASFKILETVDWKSMEGSFQPLLTVLAGIALITAGIAVIGAIGRTQPILAAAGVFFALALAIGAMAGVIYAISQIPTDTLDFLDKYRFVIGELIWGVAQFMLAIVILGSIPAIAETLQVTLAVLAAVFTTIGGVFLSIAVSIATIALAIWAAGKAAERITLAIDTFISDFTDIDWEKAAESSEGMGRFFSNLKRAFRRMRGLKLSTVISLNLLCAGIAGATALLGDVDTKSVESAAEAIGTFVETVAGYKREIHKLVDMAKDFAAICGYITLGAIALAGGAGLLVVAALELAIFASIWWTFGEGIKTQLIIFADNIKEVGEELAKYTTEIKNAVVYLISIGAGLTIAGALLLIGSYLLVKASDWMQVASDVLPDAVAALVPAIIEIGDTVEDNMRKLTRALNPIKEFALTSFKAGAVLALSGIAVYAAAYLWGESVLEITGALSTGMENLNTFCDEFEEFIDRIKAKIEELSAVTSDGWFGGILGFWRSLGNNVESGIAEGAEEQVEEDKPLYQRVVDTILGIFTGPDGFDSHSPSKKTEEIGKFVAQGLAKGMEDNAYLSKESAQLMVDETKAVFDELPTYAKNAADEASKNFTFNTKAAGPSPRPGSSQADDIAEETASTYQQAADSAAPAVSEAGSETSESYFGGMESGFTFSKDGIMNMLQKFAGSWNLDLSSFGWNSVKTWVNGFIEKLGIDTSKIKNFADIIGDIIGTALTDGIAKAIDKGIRNIARATAAEDALKVEGVQNALNATDQGSYVNSLIRQNATESSFWSNYNSYKSKLPEVPSLEALLASLMEGSTPSIDTDFGGATSDLASSISGSSGSGSGINDASKGSAIGTNGSTVTNNNNTYNFVQNNYSPEPLDRSEIYQQTKSQLNSWYNFNLEKNLAR